MTQVNTIALSPPAASKPRWLPWAIVAVAVVGAGAYYFMKHSTATASSSDAIVTGTFFTVTPSEMDIKIAKDGELQALNNVDIICHVEGLNTVQTVVPEGSSVKEGDVLLTVDSSTIRHKVDDLKQLLDDAQSALVTASEMKEIQESQNATNLDAADVAAELAKLDLKGWKEGTYPQQEKNAQTALEMAELTLKNKQDDLKSTTTLASKGFVTPSDVKKAEVDLLTAENAVEQAKTALRVLQEFQSKMDKKSKESAVAQAEQKVARTKNENASLIKQKEADVRAKTALVKKADRDYADQKEQLENCTIKAPTDGFVIYYSTIDRNASSALMEGSTIRDKQTLIRLPDTRTMKAVVRIPEGQRSRLRVDEENPMRATVKISRSPKTIELAARVARISPVYDSSMKWMNPDLKEYPVDLVLDSTPRDLKPGETVKTEIFCNHLSGVLAVPLDCIYSAGVDNYVFVHEGDELRAAKVTVGESNDTSVEIRKGLNAGDSVLRLQAGQGRVLAERNNIKVAPTTAPSGKGSGKRGPKPAAAGPVATPGKPAAG